MIIFTNLVLAIPAFIIGILNLLGIIGVIPMKSAKLGPMQERFGKVSGAVVYSLSYILMPIGLFAVLLYLTIKGISFFGLL